MTVDALRGDESASAPLTDAECARMVQFLASVGTRTLLQSLDRLNEDREDARLIIAALLARFPEQ